jgi:hypothetical protein
MSEVITPDHRGAAIDNGVVVGNQKAFTGNDVSDNRLLTFLVLGFEFANEVSGFQVIEPGVSLAGKEHGLPVRAPSVILIEAK